MTKIAALVPLRGGSKSIPDKNIRPLAGKPLCAWCLEAALASPEIDEVWVSTDSPKIKEVVLGVDPRIQVIDRPEYLATDIASTESVMLHFAEHVPFEVLVLLQATSPLTRTEDVCATVRKVTVEGCDSALTCVRFRRFFWNEDGTPINYDPLARPRRQDFQGTLMENGAIYATRRQVLLQYSSRLGGRIGLVEMPDFTAVEIDEPEDWAAIERLLC